MVNLWEKMTWSLAMKSMDIRATKMLVNGVLWEFQANIIFDEEGVFAGADGVEQAEDAEDDDDDSFVFDFFARNINWEEDDGEDDVVATIDGLVVFFGVDLLLDGVSSDGVEYDDVEWAEYGGLDDGECFGWGVVNVFDIEDWV